MLRLALALFAIQAGFHGFTASLPLALSRAGVPDPEIGLIIGTAAVIQLPAAFAAGALVDRFGGFRILAGGAIAYLVGAVVLLLPGVEPGGATWPFLAARVCQGIGVASTLPAALSLVPRIAPAARQGFAIAFIGSSHNLTLVALPPLSLAILGASSIHGVALAVIGFVLAGLALALRSGLSKVRADGIDDLYPATRTDDGPPPAKRRLGFAFRRSWARPILVVLLYVAHWGVVTAYLPQRAEAAGANVGLFFVADGVIILFVRVTSGWLTDRMPPRRLVLLGLAITVLGVALLLLPPTTPILVVAGGLTGAGSGLLLTPLLVEMSRRSSDADRGSAFSLFSGALAGGVVLGSIGVVPIVAAAGFEGAIAATLIGLALATVVALGDDGLAVRRVPRDRPLRTPLPEG